MKRRDFLKRTVPVSVLPFFIGGFTFRAYGRSALLDSLVRAGVETDRVLVLVQLNGGNDGLNTVIPLDQYTAIMNARDNIAIPENQVIPLVNNAGLHPAMGDMKILFNEKKLCIVRGVGYPNPNLSHFRGTDIWLTASDANQTLTSGWLGRYLDQEFPDYPDGYPNTVAPDPLALQIGSVVSLGLQGPTVSMGMAITSPTSFYQLITGGVDEAPNTPAGHELTFIRQVALQTQQYATSIKAAAGNGNNLSPLYPAAGQNALADQLKIVAQLISGGLKTRIYVVNIGGFDTHSDQVDETFAIHAFQDDLRLLGVEHRVIGMTFSEFGRRIKSNASFGTDHGTSAPLFVFGKNVRPQIIGTNPVLPLNATQSDNLEMQFDFRSVYASILRDWFGVSQAALEAVLLKNFASLPIIMKQRGIKYPIISGNEPSTIVENVPTEPGLHPNYPNPFNPSTKIRFSTDGKPVQIKVYDTLGREITTLVNGVYPSGIHEVVFDAADLPAGVYYYRFQSGDIQQIRSMTLVK
ncbi:MAG: DUF1501 domain-containing protein [Ignavibacteriae bacterium]|nr:DUF1501 domain-containing protein [Ignavibacteriota bacterium]